ncbi:hypothetical protein [Roseateles oligotrophus]|uniref:Uncharacterized protein n=1 Tax=Roseateles oligotrophus TaxID=1769250 RepID=A0ABT2YH39_9BURK|nr:hypothetical protein [Roseateles oligotrophus]MCV2369377.1 hypothetical protein [Roseateles oligotrophus]
MTTLTIARSFKLLAAFLASLALSAHAGTPEIPGTAAERSLLREATGYYDLEDGRTLKVDIGVHRIAVALDGQPLERWHAENADMLLSSDGHRRVRLFRNAKGSVERVAYEMDRLR